MTHGGSYSTESNHTVVITFTDSGGTKTVTKTVSAVAYPFNVLANGSAVGLMTPAVSGRKVSVPELYIGSTNVGTGLTNAANHISAVKDYIIESSYSGTWYYRKWNSGRVEAWGIVSATATAGSVWTSPIYYANVTVSIPSGIFDSAPLRAYATPANQQWWVGGVTGISTTGCTVRLLKPTSGSQAISFYLYLCSY